VQEVSERERTAQRLPMIVLAGAVFGVAMSVLKGNDAGYPTLGLAVILLLDAEPLFWSAAHRAGGVASDFQLSLAVSIGEAVVGAAVCVCVAVVLRRSHRRTALPA
jgi:hypothetical protein